MPIISVNKIKISVNINIQKYRRSAGTFLLLGTENEKDFELNYAVSVRDN